MFIIFKVAAVTNTNSVNISVIDMLYMVTANTDVIFDMKSLLNILFYIILYNYIYYFIVMTLILNEVSIY